MRDPVHDLVHHHDALNRAVVALASLVRMNSPDAARMLVRPLEDLRESLFVHFAREEEGLFPFVDEVVPDRSPQVHEMLLAHDAICGTLARMLYLARSGADGSVIAPLHERFERTYASHAQAEATLLRELDARLESAQRSRLASLVDGL